MSVDKIIASIPSRIPEERKAMREHAEKVLATGKDGTRGDARRLLEALDAQRAAEAAALAARASKLPRAQLVYEAFTAEPMREIECKIVQALLDNPGLSSSALSEKLGWGGLAWHMHSGRCARSGSAGCGLRPRLNSRG